jgi:hypothetical protein
MPRPLPRESEKPVSLDEAIANGLVAVTAAAQELGAPGEPVTCRDIGRVFDTAIEHGAPIWNDGSQLGCARIYLQAARAILEKLRTPPALTSVGVEEVLSDLRQVDEAVPNATPQNANALAWALRDLFDQFHYARGMEDVDQLIAATRASGGAIDADLICLCLTVAIAHGNNFYQKAIGACAVLHSHTARRVLDLLTELEMTDGALPSGLGRVRRELHPIVTSHPRITTANAQTLAWKLYEAFLRILKHPLTAEESRRQAGGEYQGFISYRRAGGSDAALAVRAHLQMRGLNTFLDVEGLDAGPFGPHLLRAIEQAPSFLLILTPGSLDRCVQPNDWLCSEIAQAIQTKRNIIPLLKDGFLFPGADSLPLAIRALPSYQAITYSLEFFGAVIDRIEKYMRPAR